MNIKTTEIVKNLQRTKFHHENKSPLFIVDKSWKYWFGIVGVSSANRVLWVEKTCRYLWMGICHLCYILVWQVHWHVSHKLVRVGEREACPVLYTLGLPLYVHIAIGISLEGMTGAKGLLISYLTYYCGPRSGSHVDMVYVPVVWSTFRKIWYSDQGVFIRDEGAQMA